MDTSAIAARLEAADALAPPARVRARLLRPRPAGGSRPWDCETEDGSWFVVKCSNNDQDSRLGLPLKVLSTELICGRLGWLFDPPLCPEAAVVEVPEAVAAAALHPRTKRRPPGCAAPGPGFGSRRVEGTVEIKGDAAGRLAGVAPARLARIAVFQTWLRGVDVSALVTPDGGILSIDHGYYMTNHRWDPARLAAPLPVKLKLPSQLGSPERLADPALFAPVLEELHAIPEAHIVEAFAGIPPEWGLSLELRAQAAAYVLRRREGVAGAVATLWRRSFRSEARAQASAGEGRPAQA